MNGTHVRNSECGKIIPLVLATTTPGCSGRSNSAAFAQMRRNVAATNTAQSTSGRLFVNIQPSTSTSRLFDGCHGVLEGTPSCEMLSLTNTTFDLLIPELLLNTALLAFLLCLLGMHFPVDAGPEHDVFADRGRIE